MPARLQGIDLSHHNAVTSSPLNAAFVIVRVSYGMSDGRVLPDVAADAHLERFSIGHPRVLVGYHYLSTKPQAASGEEQAAFFLERMAKLEARFGPMGRALDSEPLRAKDEHGKPIPWDPVDHVRALAIGFVTVAATVARPCLAYGSREWWARLGLDWKFAAHCPFWAASAPPPPAPWTEIAIQQWPSPVDGVDHNSFNGTADELREVLGLPVLPSPS